MKTDIEIAQSAKMLPITAIAKEAGIDAKYLEQYGNYKAKVNYTLLSETEKKEGKLILVTAITPTPAGEGKTTTTIGLADGMKKIGIFFRNLFVAVISSLPYVGFFVLIPGTAIFLAIFLPIRRHVKKKKAEAVVKEASEE